MTRGHIPLKLLAFDDGVNVTLGLPIIRTSVDHGTAFGKAGLGTARPGEHDRRAQAGGPDGKEKKLKRR